MKEKPLRKPLFYYGDRPAVLLLINFLLVPLVARHAVQEVDYGTFMTMTENKEIGQGGWRTTRSSSPTRTAARSIKPGP